MALFEAGIDDQLESEILIKPNRALLLADANSNMINFLDAIICLLPFVANLSADEVHKYDVSVKMIIAYLERYYFY